MILTNYAIKFRTAVFVFIVVLVTAGSVSYVTVPREGMPDIGAIFEAGPGVKVFIWDRDAENPLYLKAGVRAAISIDTDDLDMAYRGIRSNVKLIYRNHTWLADRGIKLGVNAGIDFANQRYNAFLYDVASQYGTPDRPEYHGNGGYTGFGLSVNAVKKINDRWSVGGYYRWDNISGTAYVDSPLVKTENNHVVGIALIWKSAQSKQFSRYSSE